ncbi:MAG: YgjP-like metallopeptidase domain-containing protein, partial [Nitrososphaeraceae archaeon]
MSTESCLEVTFPDDSIVSVLLLKSKRSRRISIRVDRYGVSVICPLNEGLESIRNFIIVNNKWILKKIQSYKKLSDKLEYGPLQKNEIVYLG